VVRLQIIHRADVFLWDDENVRRRLRVNIPEGKNGIVLEYLVGLELATHEFAEQALGIVLSHS
jgi:hypothetical protein